jgi:outer membrane protein
LFDKFAQGIEVDQLITDFGRRSNLEANSRFNEKAAQENTHATQNDILIGVTRAYFGALQAAAYVRVAEETVKARQTVADQVGALATAQLKSQLDLSFANVNVSQAKLLLIRAQAGLQQSYSDLSRALGQDHPTKFALQDIPAPSTLPPDDAALVTTAIENRPELRELRMRLEAAKKFEAAERDLKRPNVTAVAVGGALPYLNQEPRVTPHDYEGVALNLEIPIFNGHLFSARAEAARFQTEASDQRLRDTRQQIEHDVRVAWLSASNASQRIPVTEELVKQANLSLELAQGRYNLGLASIVEITQAQLAQTQALIENTGARYEYESAYAGLEYTLGTLR